MTQGIGAFCIIEYRRILHLDLEIEGIQAILRIDDDAEVRGRFGELHQGCFNLAGEDDQSANRDRIVTASLDCRDFWMRTTTGATIFPPGTREITTAIADHRGSIGSQPCPDQFTILSVRHPFTRLRIDALDQERVRPGMHTVASLTFAGHTRTKEFGHAKFIISGDVEEFFELQTDRPVPRFGTTEADLELWFPQIYAALTRLASNIETYRCCHAHGGDPEIDNEVDHAIILASIRTHWNRHHIHRHSTVMEAKTAGRQAIAIADHQNITRTHAGHPQFACIEIRPVINIPFGSKYWHAFPGSAARRMNLYCATWATRLDKCHPIWIGCTHCFLLKERKFLNIFQRLDIRWFDAHLVVQFTIKLVLTVGAFDDGLETLQLQRFEFILRKRFRLFVEELTITHPCHSSGY